MSIKTPSTRQLENLRDAYSESIDKKGKSLSSKIRELYPEPSTDDLLNPIVETVKSCLPIASKVEIDSYRFHECKRKYKIVFAIFLDPEEVKDPHAETRNDLYKAVEEAKDKKVNDLERWYLSALLAATNKTDIPSFDADYDVPKESENA